MSTKRKRVFRAPVVIREERPQASVPEFRTAYGPKLRVAIGFPEGSGRTRQSFKAECDINNIMQRFSRTGVFDSVNRQPGRYGDVSGFSYQAAMDLVVAAQAQFAELPSKVRNRFRNDPQEFLSFMENEENRDEAIKLGLIERPKEPPQSPQGDAPKGEATPPASPPVAAPVKAA